MYYSQLETMPRAKLRELQDEQLRHMTGYVYEHIPFYQEMFDSTSIKPADIRSVEDLPRLYAYTPAAARRVRLPWSAIPGTISKFSPR